MKKLTLTIGLFILVYYSASAQTPNTYPTNGNVGLGTTNPTSKVQICGDVKIDSSLTVKEDVEAQKDLKVDGDVYLGGQLIFTAPVATSTTFDKIGVLETSGEFKGVTRAGLTAALYQRTCIPFTDGTNTYFNAPAWQSFGGPNITDPKLITGIDCPARVGIGVQDPLTTLAVAGTANFTQYVSVGTISNGDAQMTVRTSNPAQYGLNVQMPYLQTQEYGILTTVKSNTIKAIAVDREDTGEDVFRVYGNGAVEAKSLRLSLNIWSDHVFNETHELMTLENLGQYIEKENHLPGVPTEKEVKENGIDVGKNDAILLEKIEETYLYLIQLNEELKKLKEENEGLKDEINLLKK